MKKNNGWFLPNLVILSLLLAACAGDGGVSLVEPEPGVKTSGGSSEEGWIDSSGVAAATAPAEMAARSDVMVEVAVEEEVMAAAGEPAAAPEAGESAVEPSLTLDQASRLTAGDVDDNARWDDYFNYRRNYSGARVIDVDVTERHQIWVKDTTGFPILGAAVRITAGGQPVAVLRTHSDGRVYFFPAAYPAGAQASQFDLEIRAGDQTRTLTIDRSSSQREWQVSLDPQGQSTAQTRLDVLFLIDATGSMADEILQLKENMRAIAARIDSLPSAPDVRFAMTVYRDRGDQFTTRTFEFTPDVEFFTEALVEVAADGGGDYPEDLNEGLYKAVRVPEWRIEETVSLIFLVADAPPHLDYADQEFSYATEMQEAASRGIKIYPIASSGLDEQGEYIFRQLAQYTGGRFLFLTYGAGGAGTTGTETDFNVDDYDVTSLDGLVIKIVEEELAHRTPFQ